LILVGILVAVLGSVFFNRRFPLRQIRVRQQVQVVFGDDAAGF